MTHRFAETLQLNITLSLVGAAFAYFLLAFGAGFAYDTQNSGYQIGQLIGGAT